MYYQGTKQCPKSHTNTNNRPKQTLDQKGFYSKGLLPTRTSVFQQEETDKTLITANNSNQKLNFRKQNLSPEESKTVHGGKFKPIAQNAEKSQTLESHSIKKPRVRTERRYEKRCN